MMLPFPSSNTGRRQLAVLTGLWTAVLPLSLQAQEEPAATAEPETLVVTGNRQAVALSQLSHNIGLIGIDEIDGVNPGHPADLLNRATGVYLQATNGLESLPAIRGPVLTGPGAAGAYQFLADGIPLRAAGFANNNGLAEANLAQAGGVEILRGPAGASHGSNAVHGIVNVLSLAPSPDSQRWTLLAGPNDRLQLRTSLSDVQDAHGLRLSAQATDDGGYRDDSDYRMQKLTLRYDYQGDNNEWMTVLSGFNLDQQTAGFIKSSDNGGDCYSSAQADHRLYRDRTAMGKNCDPDAYRQWSAWHLASHGTHQWSPDLSLGLTPYVRANSMEFRQHYLPSRAIEENRHHSAGLRGKLQWRPTEQWQWTAGIDWEWTRGRLIETQEAADRYSFGKARPQGQHYNYRVDAHNTAPYLEGRWLATPRLRIDSGLRYDDVSYRYDNRLADGTTKADGSACRDNQGNAVPCLYQRPADRRDQFSDVSHRLALNYQLVPGHQLFAAWSDGFRAPQTTDLYRLQQHQVAGSMESEEIRSLEFGLRGQQRRWRYEVLGYQMDKSHFFLRDAQGLNVTDGKTRHQGIELTFNYQPLDNLDAALHLSHGHHRYRFDNAASGIRRGNDVDTAPQTLANLRLGWTPKEHWRAELEWAYTDSYYLDPANEHSYKGHQLLHLRGSVQLSPAVRLFARVENLTDRAYASRADYAFGSYRFFGGQPRALHLGISAEF